MSSSIIRSPRRSPEDDALLARRDALPIRTPSVIGDIVYYMKGRVMILIGGTGSGKSTQTWQIMSEHCPKLMTGTRSVMTEPRVVNSLELSSRISMERIAHTGDSSYALGGRIGYSTGREKLFAREHRPSLLVNTDGTERRRAGSIIPDIYFVDEVHTFSLDSEFLLWHIRDLMLEHPTMRLVLMSATIDPGPLTEFFSPIMSDIPVLRVPGTTFPVDRQTVGASEFVPSIVSAVTAGKTLAFVHGKAAIAQTVEHLRHEISDPEAVILGFHARSSAERRKQTFEFGNDPAGTGAIVSSPALQDGITLGALRTVVDNGLIRQASVDRYWFPRLDTIRASRAEIDQRAGRVGRTAPGTAILASDTPYDAHRAYPEAAIRLSMPDAQMLLSIVKWRDPIRASREAAREGRTAFVNQPPIEHLEASMRRLRAIGAVDKQWAVTPVGKRISEFPLEPSIGRVLLAGMERGIGATMAEITALISGRGFLSGAGWKRMLPEGTGAKSDLDAHLLMLRKLTRTPVAESDLRSLRGAIFAERSRMEDPVDRAPYDAAIAELDARRHDPAFAQEPLYRYADLSCLGINGAQIDALIALRTQLQVIVGTLDERPDDRTDEHIARSLMAGYPDRIFHVQPSKRPGGDQELLHTSHPLPFRFGTSSTVKPVAGMVCFGMPFIIGQEGGEWDLGISSFNVALDRSWLDGETAWKTVTSDIAVGLGMTSHQLWTRTERMALSADERREKLAREWLVPFMIRENVGVRKLLGERGLDNPEGELVAARIMLPLAIRSDYLVEPSDYIGTQRRLRHDSSFANVLRTELPPAAKKAPRPRW